VTAQAALFDGRGEPTPEADAPPCCNCSAPVPPDYVVPDRPRHSQLCPACLEQGAIETRKRYQAEQAARAKLTPAQAEARELLAQARDLAGHAQVVTMDTARELMAQAAALTEQARKLDPDAL